MISFAELLDQLEPDAWRKDVGFKDEVAGANTELYRATVR